MSEADPLGFFNILSAKLENLVIRHDYEEIDPPPYLHNTATSNEPAEFSIRDNLEKLSIPIESDLDSHIDEHINRVYNNTTHNETNKSQLFNSILNNSAFYDTHNLNNSNAKMFKVSSLHAQLSNKSLNMNNMTVQEPISSFYHNTSVSAIPVHSQPTAGHKAPKLNSSLSASHTRPLRFNKNKDMEENNQHHFYKLTSTSKEVDIDHHTHQIEDKKYNNHSFVETSTSQIKKSNSKHDVNKSALSSSYKPSKPAKSNPTSDMNYDSGVSIRSAASIERVNDWLTNSGYQPTAPSNNTNTRDNQQLKNNKKQTEKSKQCQPKEVQPVDSSGFKTTVAYYLPGEDVAYISTFNGKNLTLSQFKQFITKKGQFR